MVGLEANGAQSKNSEGGTDRTGTHTCSVCPLGFLFDHVNRCVCSPTDEVRASVTVNRGQMCSTPCYTTQVLKALST